MNADVITAKASDVLKYGTGICHAKANLLAALLRSQGIPTGFRFQRLTLADDDSEGYCIHAYNAVWLGGRWIELDARGNCDGINAQFSLDEPKLAFQARPEYEECFYEGIYASPHPASMQMLEKVKSIAEIRATTVGIDYLTAARRLAGQEKAAWYQALLQYDVMDFPLERYAPVA